MEIPDAATFPGDPPGPLTATLVRRNPPHHPRAVLYVHGWSDYFFQTHVADYADRLGFDFYALDLRRFGRNLLDVSSGDGPDASPGEEPRVRGDVAGGFVTDLRDYGSEIDLAMAEISRTHDRVTLVGHSLGGLVTSLYADARPGVVNGLVLNAPWIANQAPVMLQAAVRQASRIGDPLRVIPLPDNGLYRRATHVDLGGQWRFDLRIKSNSERFRVRVGWMHAVLEAHAAVRRGLHIDTPVFVGMSAASGNPVRWGPEVTSTDTIIDVGEVAKAAPRLGNTVTVAKISGGMHDLALSVDDVRRHAAKELERWVGAYVE